MKTAALVLFLAIGPCLLQAQQNATAKPHTNAAGTTDTTILVEESANLKSDLAQLRAMLNVLASQESGTDARSFAALQTNRQMWQVIIGRLAELTQRLDALEKQHATTPAPEAPKRP